MQCSSCKLDKDLSEFPVRSSKVTHFCGKSYKNQCKQCNREQARKWRQDNPGKRGSGKIASIPKEDRLLVSALRVRLKQAKTRCKNKGLPEPTITDMELYAMYKEQNGRCSLTGVELSLERTHPLCLSLDQIEPSKGYTPSNTQLVAWCVNFAKGKLSQRDFIDMCKAVVTHKCTNS